jgi:pimeloyl-ACP methyl ester carboxylesterase
MTAPGSDNQGRSSSADRSSVGRHFVTVGARQVSYIRAGQGPAIACIPSLPRSTNSLLPLVQTLADSFTAFAFDLPGYGSSDPLQIEHPQIGDYADSVAQTLDALGIKRCGVYGARSGALVALDFTLRHSERVSALLMDGPPVYSDETDRADLAEHAMPFFEPRVDGTHLISLWTVVRDSYTWFPWYRREPAARVAKEPPDPEELHEVFLDYLRGVSRYDLAERAALLYEIQPGVAELSVPTVITVHSSDALAHHAQRLSGLPACAQLEIHFPDEQSDAAQRIRERFARLPVGDVPPAAPQAATLPGRITRDIVATAYGHLASRRCSDGAGRTLVMLHSSPYSSATLNPLLLSLAGSRPLVAFDTLGYGESDKPIGNPTIADFANGVIDAIERMGLGKIDLYGQSTGALIAVEVAVRRPELVQHLILEGVMLMSAKERVAMLAHFTPPFEPKWDGSHLLQIWTFMRDVNLWWPPFQKLAATRRDLAFPTTNTLHHDAVDILKAGTSYHLGPWAIWTYETEAQLVKLRPRTLVCSRPASPLYRFNDQAAALIPNAVTAQISGIPEQAAAVFSEFLDSEGSSEQRDDRQPD